MFGYVIPAEDEFDNISKSTLKQYYCSLCFELKNNFGNIPRFLISYDILLPLIICDSIGKNQNEIINTKCIKHPLTSINLFHNENLKYISDITILLSYYKALDDKKDNEETKYKDMLFNLKKYQKSISYNFLSKIFSENLSLLSSYETDNIHHSLDTLCHPFSNLVGLLMQNVPSKIEKNSIKERSLLYVLGYNLGKWIYLIDAFDDLDEDYKNKTFNPFINSTFNKNKNIKDDKYYKDNILLILLTLIDNCKKITNKISLYKNRLLIENYIDKTLINTTMNIFVSK